LIAIYHHIQQLVLKRHNHVHFLINSKIYCHLRRISCILLHGQSDKTITSERERYIINCY
jgi:hypothetical protein